MWIKDILTEHCYNLGAAKYLHSQRIGGEYDAVARFETHAVTVGTFDSREAADTHCEAVAVALNAALISSYAPESVQALRDLLPKEVLL